MGPATPIIRQLGQTDYEPVWRDMKAFTHARNETTRDELWITEHRPVYTQGLNGKAEHLLNTANIPVVQVDRGGQVTYHGPGQLVIYCLVDLTRLGMGVRSLVSAIENAIVALLARYAIDSAARPDAPGVYVGQAKIAALGLRIRKGRSYHGLSLNLDMDLSPFAGINPCGYANLAVTQLADLGVDFDTATITRQLCDELIHSIGYDTQS
jgi:lipoyl(octanoyl) transferase